MVVARRASAHTLALAHVENFRDIAEAAPQQVKAGLLFRSATPAKASAADCDYLIGRLGIRTIIDFRDAREAQRDVGDGLLRNTHFTAQGWAALGGPRGADERWLIYNPYLAQMLK